MAADAAGMAAEVDVAIVGAGLVGASLAVALAPLGYSVAVIEAREPVIAPPAWDERCLAINAASQAIFAQMGVWPALAVDAAPITATHISERGRFGVARFAAADAGLDALGWNTPMRSLNGVLDAAARQVPGVLWWCPAQLDGLEHGTDRITLLLNRGDRRGGLRARLLVAADGAASGVRARLGIDSDRRRYHQHAIVTAIRPRHAHGGIAYERFLPGGPLAILPKPDDADGPACSLVWTLPDDEAERALALDDAAFLAAVQDAFGERLGRFVALGARRAYPLERVVAERVVGPRAVLIGNAAQALHPVAAQGFNLGLRDVAALARTLSLHRGDPGDAATLAAYAAEREADRAAISRFTDRLVRTFSNRVPGWAGLRHLGLMALDLAPPLRERLMRQNLGLARGTPSIAVPQ